MSDPSNTAPGSPSGDAPSAAPTSPGGVTIAMVTALQKGQQPKINDTKSYDNGVKVVPANLLPPVIVTKENAAEAYANDPTLSALTK